MPVQELAKIMGWKTLQMAMRYYNPTAKEIVGKVRQVEALRAPRAPDPDTPQPAAAHVDTRGKVIHVNFRRVA